MISPEGIAGNAVARSFTLAESTGVTIDIDELGLAINTTGAPVELPSFSAPMFTTSIAVGDLNGDDRSDLVLGIDGLANRVFVGDGNGGFSYLGTVAVTPDRTTSVALGDFDNDGDLDLLVGNDGESNLAYLNDGSGVFGAAVVLAGEPAATHAVLAHDLDGDNRADAIVVNEGSADKVYFSQAGGGFGAAVVLPGSTGQSSAVVAGDVDGANGLDLVVGVSGEANRVYLSNAGGGFDGSDLGGGEIADTTALALHDLNNDSFSDLVVTNLGQVDKFYLNTGTGFGSATNLATTVSVSVTTGDTAGLNDQLFADANGDGEADAGTLVFVLQQALDAVAQGLGFAAGDIRVAIGPASAIVLRSNDLDYQVANADALEAQIDALLPASGTVAELTGDLNWDIEFARIADSRSVVIGDFGGSPAPDILVGVFGGADLYYENDGSGNFNGVPVAMAGGLTATTSLAIADDTNDAATYVLAAGGSGPLRVYSAPLAGAPAPAEVATSAAPLNVEAGPFVRFEAIDAQLTIGEQQFQGDFAFESHLTDSGERETTVAFLNAGATIGAAGASIVASNGEGLFVIRSDGIAGTASVDVAVSVPDLAVNGSGTYRLAINTFTEPVRLSTPIRGSPLTLDLDAGRFIRVERSNVNIDLSLASGSQSLQADIAFERRLVSSSPGVTAEPSLTIGLANLSLSLSDAGGTLFSVTNGRGVLVADAAGVAGSIEADVTLDPVAGLSLSGSFGVEFNTTASARFIELQVAGQLVAHDLDAGPYVQVVASGARLIAAGLEIEAERFTFRQSTGTIALSGANAGFVLSADGKRMIGVRDADFAFVLTRDGLSGAILDGELLGPDLGGDVTLSRTHRAVVEYNAERSSRHRAGRRCADLDWLAGWRFKRNRFDRRRRALPDHSSRRGSGRRQLDHRRRYRGRRNSPDRLQQRDHTDAR